MYPKSWYHKYHELRSLIAIGDYFKIIKIIFKKAQNISFVSSLFYQTIIKTFLKKFNYERVFWLFLLFVFFLLLLFLFFVFRFWLCFFLMASMFNVSISQNVGNRSEKNWRYFPSKFKIGLLYYKYFIPNTWKPIQPLVFGSNTAGNN